MAQRVIAQKPRPKLTINKEKILFETATGSFVEGRLSEKKVFVLLTEVSGRRALRFLNSLEKLPHHPNILTYLGYYPEGIVFEYFNCMQLSQFLSMLKNRRLTLSYNASNYILNNIMKGILHYYQLADAYRDLNPNNVLIGENGEVELIPTGYFKPHQQVNPDITVSSDLFSLNPHFAAPEVLTKLDKISKRSDVFSLGAMAVYLYSGSPLFEGQSFQHIKDHYLTILSGDSWISNPYVAEMPQFDLDEEKKELLLNMLRIKVKGRASWREVIESGIFESNEEEAKEELAALFRSLQAPPRNPSKLLKALTIAFLLTTAAFTLYSFLSDVYQNITAEFSHQQ